MTDTILTQAARHATILPAQPVLCLTTDRPAARPAGVATPLPSAGLPASLTDTGRIRVGAGFGRKSTKG